MVNLRAALLTALGIALGSGCSHDRALVEESDWNDLTAELWTEYSECYWKMGAYERLIDAVVSARMGDDREARRLIDEAGFLRADDRIRRFEELWQSRPPAVEYVPPPLPPVQGEPIVSVDLQALPQDGEAGQWEPYLEAAWSEVLLWSDTFPAGRASEPPVSLFARWKKVLKDRYGIVLRFENGDGGSRLD